MGEGLSDWLVKYTITHSVDFSMKDQAMIPLNPQGSRPKAKNRIVECCKGKPVTRGK